MAKEEEKYENIKTEAERLRCMMIDDTIDTIDFIDETVTDEHVIVYC